MSEISQQPAVQNEHADQLEEFRFKTVSHILQKLRITETLPYYLTPDMQIRMATDEEIVRFKEYLTSRFFNGIPVVEDQFENDIIETDNEKGLYTLLPLERSQWRYYVIEENGNGDSLLKLDLISNICDLPLFCSTLRFQNLGIVTNPSHLTNIFDFSSRIKPTLDFTHHDLSQLESLFNRYSNLSEQRFKDEIYRALIMFNDLKSLPGRSQFTVIGLFAIIEMMLTHAPQPKLNYDSITHQMRHKIPLMANRFEKPLDYKSYFGETSVKKVWDALYAFRSGIAHGGGADFSSGSLKCLKDSNNATDFLKKVVGLLLRQYIKEPQLFEDLKPC